jgi:hypothetical protein
MQYVDYSVLLVIWQRALSLIVALWSITRLSLMWSRMIWFTINLSRQDTHLMLRLEMVCIFIYPIPPPSPRASIWQCANSYTGLLSSEGYEHRNQRRVMVCVYRPFYTRPLFWLIHLITHSCPLLALGTYEIYFPFSLQNPPRFVMILSRTISLPRWS